MVVVSGALLVSDWIPWCQVNDSVLKCYTGGGGKATDELHTDIPALAQWTGKLLHLQRHFQTGVPRIRLKGTI